jgi:cell division protein FtsL
MSLARQDQFLNRSVEGSAALPLPQEIRAPRQAPRPRPKKRSLAGVVAIGLGWVCVLALSLVVVHRNTLVLSETGKITELKEQIQVQERLIHEKETQVAQAGSMGMVEEWAKAQGMVRTANVKTVAPDASAVAMKEVQPEPAPVVAEATQGSFLDAVKSYLSEWQAARAEAAGR